LTELTSREYNKLDKAMEDISDVFNALKEREPSSQFPQNELSNILSSLGDLLYRDLKIE